MQISDPDSCLPPSPGFGGGPGRGPSQLITIRQHYQTIAAVALVIGFILITIAEMPDFDWTRALGAAAITVGGIGLGVYVGLSNPGRYRAVRDRLSSSKVGIGLVVVTLLFLPALLGLVAGIIGLLSDPDGTGWVMATGAALLVVTLAATSAAFAVGIAAVVGAGRVRTGEAEEA